MQLVIGQKLINKIISIAQGVVPKRSTKPILTHVLLDADPERGLVVSATDDELSFTGVTQAQVKEAGSATVLAKDLYDVIRNLPDRDIQITHKADTSQVEIVCDSIQFQLQSLPSDEFPQPPRLKPEETHIFDAKTLDWLIEHTLFAVSTEETRYYLGGVFMETHEGKLRAVSTDGHRLAMAETVAPDGFALQPGQILPRKLLGELRKILSDAEGGVEFGFLDKKVIFRCGSQTLSSLLVEGTFPDYRQVIPKSPSVQCRVLRSSLLEALRRISLLSPDKTGGVRFTLKDHLLGISSQHTGRGMAQEDIEILEGASPEAIEIGFNANYFLDALKVIGTEHVMLEFTNHLSPCLLSAAYKDDDEAAKHADQHHLNVIMPMRL